jgi:hypothetical protein
MRRTGPSGPFERPATLVIDRTSAWYVADALGERLTSAPRLTVPRLSILALLTAAVALALGACGGDDGNARQDADEPEGDYPVEVTTSRFPTRQRLAETSDLVLGVENVGDEPLPELAFTIFTDDGDADGSFKIRSDQAGLADPNQAVWILENKFPRFVGDPPPQGLSPGLRAQTNTFGFGPLEPGESREVIWRVTPVMPGTYTLNYIVAAGLDGNARAVTEDGGEVKGEFVVTITDRPPRARVNDAGEVVTEDD